MFSASYRIISVLLAASILSFWKLGQVPRGLSVSEIDFSFVLSRFAGEYAFDAFAVRLPTAIAGVAFLYVYFLVIKSLFKSSGIGLIATGLAAFSPWFIFSSRILNPDFLISLTIFVTVNVLFIYFGKKRAIMFSVLLLLVTLIGKLFTGINSDTLNLIDRQRNSMPNTPVLLRRVFINKYTVNLQNEVKLVFENLDIGNYFFSGHPRERWGIEETPKIFFTLLPVFLYGIFFIARTQNQLLIYWLITSTSVLVITGNNLISEGIVVVSLISTVAFTLANINMRKMSFIWIFFSLSFIFEMLNFLTNYFSGNIEARFSQRREVYTKVADSVLKNVEPNQRIIVNEKIYEFDKYLRFYSKNKLKNEIVVTKLNVKLAKPDGLIIDTLPFEPSPSEPLYSENGMDPEFIGIISKFSDVNSRQTIYIYE